MEYIINDYEHRFKIKQDELIFIKIEHSVKSNLLVHVQVFASKTYSFLSYAFLI